VTKRIRKGISTLFLSFIFSIIVLMVFTYALVGITTSMFQSTAAMRSIAEYSYKHELSQIVITEDDGTTATLKNLGSSDIVMDKVVVRTRSSGSIEIKNASDMCFSSGRPILPAYGEIKCMSSGYEYIAIVTRDGIVIYPRKPMIKPGIVETNVTRIIPITFNINNPEDLAAEFDADPQLIAKPYTKDRASEYGGIKSTSKLLLLPVGQESEFESTSVSTSGTGISFGIAIIGLDPSWVREKIDNPSRAIPPRLSIMLAGPAFTGSNEKIDIGKKITLSRNGFRILINNFTGTVEIVKGSSVIACTSTAPNGCSDDVLPALGFWYYGSTGLGLRIRLNGFATYVAVFMRMASSHSQSPTGETSYYPYLYVGDVDGNGLNDIVFVTEDAYYGDRSMTNDKYRNDDLSDLSTTPLVLKLKRIGMELGSPDGSIDGRIYAGIALYLNLIFHDNSHPDTTQLEDIDRTDWVLRILLVDENGNEYVVREYKYQEICNYHKTLVTDFGNDNYFVKISQSIYVNLPSKGRYWIAVAFQDPYGGGPTNDADLTVGVEFIGAIPFLR